MKNIVKIADGLDWLEGRMCSSRVPQAAGSGGIVGTVQAARNPLIQFLRRELSRQSSDDWSSCCDETSEVTLPGWEEQDHQPSWGGPVPNPMTFNLQERQKKCLICLFVQGKVVYCSLWIFIFYSTYLKTVCLMGKDFWGEINWRIQS